MIALIDADSILWIIAYNYKDPACTIDEVVAATQIFIKEILMLTRATHYYGSLGGGMNFRYDHYRYAKYKGNRGEKPDWMIRWEGTIKDYMVSIGFAIAENLEADDVISQLAYQYREAGQEYVICSPDKDLRQIPGKHFDYREGKHEMFDVSPEQAKYNFWMQMLMGDSTDNVAGVPGLGEVKAAKLLEPCKEDPLSYRTIVINAYRKQFGDYYGPLIFEETKMVIMLLTPMHPILQYSPEIWGNTMTLSPVSRITGEEGDLLFG